MTDGTGSSGVHGSGTTGWRSWISEKASKEVWSSANGAMATQPLCMAYVSVPSSDSFGGRHLLFSWVQKTGLSAAKTNCVVVFQLDTLLDALLIQERSVAATDVL